MWPADARQSVINLGSFRSPIGRQLETLNRQPNPGILDENSASNALIRRVAAVRQARDEPASAAACEALATHLQAEHDASAEDARAYVTALHSYRLDDPMQEPPTGRQQRWRPVSAGLIQGSRHFLRQGDAPLAIAALSALRSVGGLGDAARLQLAEACLVQRMRSQALELLEAPCRTEAMELRRLMAIGRLHLQGREPERALKAFEQAVALAPGNADATVQLAIAAESGGHLEQAIDLLEDGLPRLDRPNLRAVRAFCRVALQLSQFERLTGSEHVLSRHWTSPETTALYLTVARALQDGAASLQWNPDFEQWVKETHEELAFVAQHLCRDHRADLADALLACVPTSALAGPQTALQVLHARLSVARGNREQGLERATTLLRDPTLPAAQRVLLLKQLLACGIGAEPFIDLLRTAGEPLSATSRQELLLSCADDCLARGDAAGLAAALGELGDAELEDGQWLYHDWLCQQMTGTGAPIRRALSPPDFPRPELLSAGSLAHYRFSNERCMIWLSGVARTNFFSQLFAAMSAFRDAGVSLLVVHDPHGLAGLNGFGRFYGRAADSERELQGQVEQLGYPCYATMGQSVGAFSALRYATRIGAGGALVFSPVTRFPTVEAWNTVWGGNTVQKAWREMRPFGPTEIAPLLRARPDFTVHTHFGQHSKLDCGMDSLLEGLPNVHRHPYPHGEHNAIGPLIRDGLLAGTVRTLLTAIER